MEIEHQFQEDGPTGSGQSRMLPTCGNSQLEHRSVELEELSELHVPTHEFRQRSEAPDPGCRHSPHITSPEDSHHTMIETTVHQDDSIINAPNLDRSSLESPTEATISTSSASLSPSSGGASIGMTVSSAPTSMSSGSSEITGVNTLELEKGVFAAPKLALEPKDRWAWDKIQPRLQHTIDNTLQTRQGFESTISCEFMMGGSSPKLLKPTIFLVCCHETYRKQLRTIMKRQKWMREYGYQCVVIVDAFEELSYGNMHDTPDTGLIHIQASLQTRKISLCGLQARAQTRSHDTPVKFTIGGILLIDYRAVGLTVGHAVEKLILSQDCISDDENDDDDSFSITDDSSPFIGFEEEDLVKISGFSKAGNSAPSLELQGTASCENPTTVRDRGSSQQTEAGRWGHLGHFHAATARRSTVGRSRLDWSLVNIDSRLPTFDGPLINTLDLPTGDSIRINKFLQTSDIIGGEVWINAGSTGVIRGWLMDSPVLFHQYGKTFQVLQVISDIPLGM